MIIHKDAYLTSADRGLLVETFLSDESPRVIVKAMGVSPTTVRRCGAGKRRGAGSEASLLEAAPESEPASSAPARQIARLRRNRRSTPRIVGELGDAARDGRPVTPARGATEIPQPADAGYALRADLAGGVSAFGHQEAGSH